ncbi:hypothetical protein [Rhizobium sullae]|uniref:Uncharacterized protein n=1 Tax=Rhizobium sullae TaxID=50338 RepID=A0A4R3Q6Z7_RHISU|nr:hypothetical protein [Rhizobium sullae]TCU13706.1 hypothetical protein EV132_111139 [Rhizobium sullae]
MSQKLHPYRFDAARRAAWGRRREARLPDSYPESILKRQDLVREVRDLICDWRQAGEVIFDMEARLEEYAGVESIEVDGGPKITIPAAVLYVHFGEGAALHIEDDDAFIDGMYVREAVEDGKIGLEFTFVCNESAWDRFDVISETKILNTVGRVVNAFAPFGASIERGMRRLGFRGCMSVIDDPAFELAIQRSLLCMKEVCISVQTRRR